MIKTQKDIAKALKLSIGETVSKFQKFEYRIGEHGRLISGGQRQRIALRAPFYQKKDFN